MGRFRFSVPPLYACINPRASIFLQNVDASTVSAMAELGKDPKKVAAARARAKSLTREERHEIALRAAAARWGEPILKATHGSPDHPLKIGALEIPAYVLEDGRRVLVQRGMMTALDIKQGTAGRGGGDRIAKFVATRGVSEFISKDLAEVINRPIKFTAPHGSIAYGYEATILTDICEAVLAARRAGKLHYQQEHIATQCEVLVRGLARTGIIALVDEVTGYQDQRAKTALRDIFDAFLRKELAAWVKRFPEEFYREIFRLRGWDWKGMKVNRPQVVAYYTVDIVYSRLLPHIMEELENRMPRTESGRRKGKLHQLFSDDVGHPALAQHLYAVITLMRVADDWESFMQMLDKAHPRKTDKWLKELLQANNNSAPAPANDSGDALPLLALMHQASPK